MLIVGWDRGKPAAFDVTVASPLCPATLMDSSRMSGAASAAAEARKIMVPNVRSWGGHAFHWLSRPSAIGVKRLI